jgi:transposase
MRDVDLYQAILGIVTPWRVVKVDLALEAGRVDVWVEHGRGERFPCPECSEPCTVYDHSAQRTWRHLDTCQYKTLLHTYPGWAGVCAKWPSGAPRVTSTHRHINRAVFVEWPRSPWWL